MENASKALIMAGAVLLAILIVSALIYFFSQPERMYSSINDKREAQNLQEFNKQYEAFNRDNLYGVDIISVMNKVIDNNKKNEDYPELSVEIEVTIKAPSDTNKDVLDFLHPTGSEKKYNVATGLNAKLVEINANSSDFSNGFTEDLRTFKVTKFRCIGIEYSATTSRVNLLKFEQVIR